MPDKNNFDKMLDGLNNLIKVIIPKKKRALSIDDVLWNLYFEIVDERPMAYVNGFYIEDSKMFAIISDSGKLYKADVKFKDQEAHISGEWVEVILEFNPTESRENGQFLELARSIYDNKNKASTTIRRTEDGKWRWISISCSAVLNRSGSIDSRKLMDSFIEHIEEGEAYPHREFYHMGEQYRTGQTDYVARDGYLLITSGVYDDSELAELEIKARQADPEYWGDSIEFQPTAEPEIVEVIDGVEIEIYNDGILRSISTLPENEAAALFTSETILTEVRMTLNPKAREAFILLFDGDEEAAEKWLEENTDPTNRQISDEDLVARAKADKEAKAKAEKEAKEKEARDKADKDNLDPEADKSDADPDAEPGEADADSDDDDDSDADDDKNADKEFVIPEELIPVLQEAILKDERFEALLQVPGIVVKLVEQIGEVADKMTAFEERIAVTERSDEVKQDAWSKDLGKKARQIVEVTYRRKEADDDDDNDEPEPTDTAKHVKEILKDVPQYGPDTPLKNMPE